MIHTNLPPELENALVIAAGARSQSVDELVQQVLAEFLKDLTDMAEAKAVMARNEPTITLDQLERDLGLAH